VPPADHLDGVISEGTRTPGTRRVEASAWHVYKFGGSSLGTLGRLQQVLKLIEQAAKEGPLAVVVSALGDTTDSLEHAVESAAGGKLPQAVNEVLEVRSLALKIAATVLTAEGLERFEAEAAALLSPTIAALATIAQKGEYSPAQRDEVLAVGEPMAALLVSIALREQKVPAEAVDARDFITTDNAFGSAAIEWAPTAERFNAIKDGWRDVIPIITGFIGRTREALTTTLGRNGSDYTATVVAALLQAGLVTVWTDVPGVMTADPAIVPEAAPVDRLSYDEALELAYFGSRMFHPRTVIPLRDYGAEIVIRSTMHPDEPGTRIDGRGNPDRPTCVTSLENLALLGISSRRAGIGAPLAGRIVPLLAAAGIRVWIAVESTLGQTLSLLVPQAESQTAVNLVQAVVTREVTAGELVLSAPNAPVTLLTLVAGPMGQRPNVAGRFLSAVGRAGISVRAIAQGGAQRSVSCVIDGEDTAIAVRTVHAAFNLAQVEINAFLLGKGNVGTCLLKQLERQEGTLHRHHDINVRLVGVADRTRVVFSPKDLSPSEALARLCNAPGEVRTGPTLDALLPRLAALPNPVLVDCTSADGMESLYARAFGQGINVVSANKKPLALPQREHDVLKAAARRHYRAYHYETTVGAALPIVDTLKNLVRTGDAVRRIEGAFSGTLGFLCERLMAGERLSAAVRRARALGYTEPHPRDDLSGLDVARKALILARELGLSLDISDVRLEPFVPASFLAAEDSEVFFSELEKFDARMEEEVGKLRKRGLCLRYLASIEPFNRDARIKVAPVGVGPTHPAASLRGAESFAAFHTERYRDFPLVVRGAGAGGEITASGVLADMLRLAQNIRGRP
jgi:aspartokinase/homoserine dehydrogenase 1